MAKKKHANQDVQGITDETTADLTNEDTGFEETNEVGGEVVGGEMTAGGEVAAGEQAATAKKLADIVRGRMPLPIVFLVKFADSAVTDAALATRFKTTSGKVNDIRKERNFGYITMDYKPSQEMKDRAAAYASQLPDKTVLDDVNALEIADATSQAAFDELRKGSRPGRKKKEAAPATTEVVPEAVSGEELEGLTE